MPIELILSRLKKVKKSAKQGQYIACCPAHDDKNPSLGILEAPDGRILIHCRAGCGGAEVMQAIGLTLSDLYPDGAIQDFMKSAAQKKKETKWDSVLWLADETRKRGVKLSKEGLKLERLAYMRTRK